MFSEYNFKNFNFRLLFYALALNAIGLLVINSAVNGDRSYINRQLIGLFGGLVIMLFLALTDYHKLMRCTGVIYLGCVVILLAIIVAGQFGGAGTGARRWITLPVIGRFQPSEFVKIGLIIFFSWFLQRNQEKINNLRTLIIVGAFAAVPLLLIMKQPDLSTSIVIMFIIVCLIFVAGLSYKWIVGADPGAGPHGISRRAGRCAVSDRIPGKPNPCLRQSWKIRGPECPAG